MAFSQTFDGAYGDNPWANITTNQRKYYDPILREMFHRSALYSRFATIQFNLGSVNATEMEVTTLIPPHANHDPLSDRQMWLPSSIMDSEARRIKFQHYGGKLAFSEYDDLVTYWIQKGRTDAGLVPIIKKYLGYMIIDTLDKLARDAFMLGSRNGGFVWYGPDNSLSSFDDLRSNHTVTTDLIDEIHLGMGERGVPYARGENGPVGEIICITSPGVVYNLQRESSAQTADNKWVNAVQYADAMRLVRGEVGSYHHVRFVQSPAAILRNAGHIIVQATVTSAIAAGDGAPDPATTTVDGVKYVGQPGAAKHYVQLDPATDMTEFKVNDIVALHVDRTNANGVTNGVDFTDGKLMHKRIVSIDASNKRLAFATPIMEPFETDLGGGVFAYVTKAHNVHSMLFLGGNDGVVMGMGRPIRVHTPPPVDDMMSMYRISWDGRFGYTPWQPYNYEVAFVSAPSRFKGAPVLGVAP